MEQKAAVLRHLKKYKSITRMQAYEKYGICNLWARIAELRETGKRIGSYPIQVKNRYGKKCTVSRYYLAR